MAPASTLGSSSSSTHNASAMVASTDNMRRFLAPRLLIEMKDAIVCGLGGPGNAQLVPSRIAYKVPNAETKSPWHHKAPASAAPFPTIPPRNVTILCATLQSLRISTHPAEHQHVTDRIFRWLWRPFFVTFTLRPSSSAWGDHIVVADANNAKLRRGSVTRGGRAAATVLVPIMLATTTT